MACIAIAVCFALLAGLGYLLGAPDKAKFLVYLVPVVWVVIIGAAIFGKPKLKKRDPAMMNEFAMALATISGKRGDDLIDYIVTAFDDRGSERPTDEQLAAVVHQVDRNFAKGASFTAAPAIVMMRTDDPTSTSWLGGRPTLANTLWPVDENNIPLHHVAQINLGDLPSAALPAGLPRHGALAFFIRTIQGRALGSVVFVDDTTSAPSIPPLNLPDPFSGSPYHNQAPDAPFFARRGLAPHLLSGATATKRNAIVSAMKNRAPDLHRWHQMFGIGLEIQITVEEHPHDHLLFEFHPDTAMHPDWTETGVYQFWISDDALVQRDWTKVEMTYACN